MSRKFVKYDTVTGEKILAPIEETDLDGLPIGGMPDGTVNNSILHYVLSLSEWQELTKVLAYISTDEDTHDYLEAKIKIVGPDDENYYALLRANEKSANLDLKTGSTSTFASLRAEHRNYSSPQQLSRLDLQANGFPIMLKAITGVSDTEKLFFIGDRFYVTNGGTVKAKSLEGTGDRYIGADSDGEIIEMPTPEEFTLPGGFEGQILSLNIMNEPVWIDPPVVTDIFSRHTIPLQGFSLLLQQQYDGQALDPGWYDVHAFVGVLETDMLDVEVNCELMQSLEIWDDSINDYLEIGGSHIFSDSSPVPTSKMINKTLQGSAIIQLDTLGNIRLRVSLPNGQKKSITGGYIHAKKMN